ncbi:hypothetical protein TNCV_4032411, partial [Trichonephila clavipes]
MVFGVFLAEPEDLDHYRGNSNSAAQFPSMRVNSAYIDERIWVPRSEVITEGQPKREIHLSKIAWEMVFACMSGIGIASGHLEKRSNL